MSERPVSSVYGRQRPFLSPFDRVVLSVALVLVLLVGLTIGLGDRVGVQLVRVDPLGVARSTSGVLIQFSETMNRETVTGRLHLEPAVAGDFSWNDTTLLFRPAQALRPGTEYTVILEPGAESASGRQVLNEYRFSFMVRSPRVAYLYPSDSRPQNIWIADPTDPDSARQLTFSTGTIFDFAASPDGTRIAIAEREGDIYTTNLKLLDLETGEIQPITNCPDSDCTGPVWRPDGRMIAYERVELNSPLPQVGVSPPRVWLIDLTTTPPSTRPLFSDSQVLGYGPQWSADGQRIAVYDSSGPGILIYDFAEDDLSFVPSTYGSLGALSPDGTRLVFPEVFAGDGGFVANLQVADLETDTFKRLTGEDEPVDDDMPLWTLDGSAIVIARRYQDNRYTLGRQLYLKPMPSGEVTPLLVDERYSHGFYSWDPTGSQLVIQRFPLLNEDGSRNDFGRPEIWTYDVANDRLTQIASNAMLGRWVP